MNSLLINRGWPFRPCWYLLCLALIGLSMSLVWAAEFKGVTLRVSAEAAGERGWERSLCELINNSGVDLPYDLSEEPGGFLFELLAVDGKPLPMIKEWALYNTPRNAGAHIGKIIPPGETLRYILDLRDAYGENRLKGNDLIVRWQQGHAVPVNNFFYKHIVRETLNLTGVPGGVSPDLGADPRADSYLSSIVRPEAQASPIMHQQWPTEASPRSFWWAWALGVLAVGALVLWRVILSTRSKDQ